MTSGIRNDAGDSSDAIGHGSSDPVSGSGDGRVSSESTKPVKVKSQNRKYRGYASQRIAAEYLRTHGFPHAEPVGAGRTGSDVTGLIGIDLEVKARAGLDLPALMRQLKQRDMEGCIGVGRLRLNGQGPAQIEEWPAVIRFSDLVDLLRSSGYGDPL